MSAFNQFWFSYGGGGYLPLTKAFLVATGITNVVIADGLNTFEGGLISNGLLSKIFAYWPMVGGTSDTDKINFMDARDLDAAYRLQFNGGWTHSVTGALPNGINAYARTYYTPSAPNLNSFSIGYYSRTNSSATEVEIGCSDGTSYELLEINTGGATYAAINNLAAFPYMDANSLGMYIASRSAANLTAQFKNDTSRASDPTAPISVPAKEIYLAAFNNNGTASNYSTKECASAFIGSGLSDPEAIILSGLINTLQTTLGRNVY